MRTVIRNANVLDTDRMEFLGEHTLVVEDGIIVDDAAGATAGDIELDVSGKFVVPGLIDAHVHMRLATLDFRSLARWSEVEFGVTMAALATATVERGFTTVRDLGGDVSGLMRAISRGATVGPRIVRAGRMLSQTGGHGDVRPSDTALPSCGCTLESDVMSIIADGPDAVRKAARHLLRDGSDFLKIHVSGGVASPTDPLESVQYTHAEVAAVVTEATHRGTYVAAHAYSPESITMAIECGVHSIEHGNLLDDATALRIAAANAVLVPTLVTYKAMDDLGEQLGLPAANLAKNTVVYESGLASLERARSAGVTLGFGTDLIGETQPMQNQELLIRAGVEPAADVLRSLWGVNAQLCRLADSVGVLTPGAFGDIVVSTVNPLDDLAGFADAAKTHTHVIQGGRIVIDRST